MSKEAAIEKIRRAIENPGSHPAYHREVMTRHRKEWPVLWRAIDELMRESRA